RRRQRVRRLVGKPGRLLRPSDSQGDHGGPRRLNLAPDTMVFGRRARVSRALVLSRFAMTDREFAVDVVRRLRQSAYEAYLPGGCVRDELLNLVPADYDVATSARPEDVVKTFKKTVGGGGSFVVVEVI